MATIKKVGDEYFVEFYGNGLLFQKWAGKNLEYAEKMCVEIEESLKREGTSIFTVKEADFDIFYDEFCAWAQKEHFSKTYKRFKTVFDSFRCFFKAQYPDAKKIKIITPFVIEQFKEQLLSQQPPLKPQAINFQLYLLRFIFEDAIKRGYLNDNPTLHVKFYGLKHSYYKKFTSFEKMTEIAQSLCEPAKTIARTILFTGLTLEEIKKLTWQDVHLGERRIRIRFNSRERDIPIVQELYEMLVNFKKDSSKPIFGHLDANAIDNLLQPYRLSWPDFRHGFALHLLEKKMPLLSVYKLLGLSDIAQVMIYAPYDQTVDISRKL